MASWLKTGIRLDRIATRQLKTSYKRLALEEKKLVKIIETLALNESDTNKFWRYIKRDENGAAIFDDKDSEIFTFYENRRKLYNRKLERIKIKNNWIEEKINQIWRLHQQDNCHSVSY